MRKLVATSHLTDDEVLAVMSTHMTAGGFRLVDRDLRVVTQEGKFIATFIKGQVPLQLQQTAEPYLKRAHGDFGNRGSVVGKGAMMPRIRKDGTLSARRAVPRDVRRLLGKTDQIGWFDRHDPKVGVVVCRQSRWSLDEPEVLATALPLVEWVDYLFSLHCPKEYAAQLAAVESIAAAFRMSGGWANLTVNVNARTAVHKDKGGVRGGTAALLASGTFDGGHLLLPRYKLAFDVREGDVLIFDPHEPHGNAPVSGERLSVVIYARERLSECSAPTT